MDRLTALQRKNLEAAVGLAKLAIETSQKILQIQAEASRELVDGSIRSINAITQKQDYQEALSVRASSAEKMMEAARKIAQVSSEAQSEVGRVLTQQMAGGGQEMAAAFEKFLASFPQSNPETMQAMQTAFNNTRSAFEQMTKATARAFTNIQENGGRPHSKKRGEE